jgi:hypothetical protein
LKAIDQLLSSALLGTGRGEFKLPPLDQRLNEVLAPTAAESAESRLLSAMAVLSIYSKAGLRAVQGVEQLPRCEKEESPSCPQRAGEVLERLLRDGPRELISEWLTYVRRTATHPPAHLLPRLLDAAVDQRHLREMVSAVAGSRGRWLISLNQRWQFTTVSDDHEQTWQAGNSDQRTAALRAVRQADAVRARDLLASTWKDDSVDDRVRFLDVMSIHLSGADEAFLESCLDDRSKTVRETAAVLLSRLVNSQFARRMTARVAACLQFTPAAAGAMLKLKRAKPASIEVILPAEFDKSMQRDGISEKPPPGVGQKQWWLQQMVALVAPTYWSTNWQTPPAQIVAADCDFKDLLRVAWVEATQRNPNSEWAVALLQAKHSEQSGDDLQLLRCVDESQRDEAMELVLNARRSKELPEILSAIVQTGMSLSEKTSLAILDKFDPEQLLGHLKLATLLHPSSLASLEKRLEPLSGKPYTGKAADDLLRFVAVRRELHGSFGL